MKYPVTQFKNLSLALKELEPFIRNGQHLQTGRPFAKFGSMLSREILANWLLCVAINSTDKRELTFSSDPVGGDGVICDRATGETWPTEHVMVPSVRDSKRVDAETLILKAIGKKHSKGFAAYAAGKTLMVFLNAGAGAWFPNRVASQLPDPLYFAAVWVVGLHGIEDESYLYNVTCLDLTNGNAPAMRVQLGKAFESWSVERIQ